MHFRLPSPPVQAVELNTLAVVTDDYEDVAEYSAAVPIGDDYEVVSYDNNDDVEALGPVEGTTSGGDYNIVECPAYIPIESRAQMSV